VASEARGARIADQIQRELAELIRTEVRDPRVGLVTLTGVELSRDQSHAKVFFTVLGADAGEALEGLGRAAGFLRSELARRLTTRKVPELHFEYDESVERGVRLSKLIDDAIKSTLPPKRTRAARPAKPAAAPVARKPRSTKG
jgi:ribosome-binding factor A